MLNPSLRAVCSAIVSTLLLVGTVPAAADYTRVTITGTISAVETNTGGGTFTGLGEGATITGEFRYGTSATDATSVDEGPTSVEYFFTGNNYGASVASGSAGFEGDRVWLFVDDNFPIDAEDADIVALVNQEFGLNIQVGNQLDSWGLDAESPDAIYDNTEDCLANGVDLEVILVDVDATMYSGASFHAEPPAQNVIDAPLFFIEEASGGPTGCNTIYSAFGTITDLQYELVEEPVPESGNKGMPWLPILLEE